MGAIGLDRLAERTDPAVVDPVVAMASTDESTGDKCVSINVYCAAKPWVLVKFTSSDNRKPACWRVLVTSPRRCTCLRGTVWLLLVRFQPQFFAFFRAGSGRKVSAVDEAAVRLPLLLVVVLVVGLPAAARNTSSQALMLECDNSLEWYYFLLLSRQLNSYQTWSDDISSQRFLQMSMGKGQFVGSICGIVHVERRALAIE